METQFERQHNLKTKFEEDKYVIFKGVRQIRIVFK